MLPELLLLVGIVDALLVLRGAEIERVQLAARRLAEPEPPMPLSPLPAAFSLEGVRL